MSFIIEPQLLEFPCNLPLQLSGISTKAASMELTNDPPQKDKLSYSLCQMFKVLCNYSCQSVATTTATEQGLKECVQGKEHRDIEESSKSQSKVADKASPADGSKEVNKQLSSNIVKLSFFCDVCKLKCNNQSMLDSCLNAEQFINRDICKNKCYHQSALNFHLNGKKHKAQCVEIAKAQDDTLILPVDDKLVNDNLAIAERLFNCSICQAKCHSQSILNIHLNGKKHKAQLEKLNKVQDAKLISPEEANKLANNKPATAEQLFNCDICKVKCDHQSTVNSHLNGNKHKAHLEKLSKVQDDKLISPEEANKFANDKPATAQRLFNCGICDSKCYSHSIMNIHLNGKKHKAQLEKLNNVHDDRLITLEDNRLANDQPASAKPFFNCDICKVKCDHQSTVNSHLNGKKHKAHLEKLNKVQDDKLISPEGANKLANNKLATAEQNFNCGICKAKCYSQSIMNIHLNGKKHKAQLEKLNKAHDDRLITPEDNKLANDKPDSAKTFFNCDICKVKCYHQSSLNSHLNGKKHKAHYEKRNKVQDDKLISPEEDNKLANDKPATAHRLFNCGICNSKCYSQSIMNIHLNGKKHKAQLEKLNNVHDDRLITLEDNRLANDQPASAKPFFNCDSCMVKCDHQSTVNSHLNGKKHKAHLEKLNKVQDDKLISPEEANKLAYNKPATAEHNFNCGICKAKCYSQSIMNIHLNGKKHKAHYEKLSKVQDDNLISAKEANELANDKPAIAGQLDNCGICKAKCYSQSILNSHLNGKKHKAQLEKHNKVPNNLLHHKALFKMKAGDRKENPLKVEIDDEEECYEIDPIIFIHKLTFDDTDDVALVAEKGPVALRDFPHPRHLCGCLPFGTTSHESFCAKCFCCVCEVVAPCKQWRGINGHCHLSEKIQRGV